MTTAPLISAQRPCDQFLTVARLVAILIPVLIATAVAVLVPTVASLRILARANTLPFGNAIVALVVARRRQADRRGWPKHLHRNLAATYLYPNTETGKSFFLGKDFRLAKPQATAANAELERRKGASDLLQRMACGGISLTDWCDKFDEIVDARGALVKETLAVVKGALRAVRGQRRGRHQPTRDCRMGDQHCRDGRRQPCRPAASATDRGTDLERILNALR